MIFFVNENFPGPSIAFLRDNNIDIKSIAENYPGISEEQVMKQAIDERRTIVTHDSDLCTEKSQLLLSQRQRHFKRRWIKRKSWGVQPKNFNLQP